LEPAVANTTRPRPRRRQVILDAAIGLVGLGGRRALTHRAVDDIASVPQGTTSNYFRTQKALVEGVVVRLADRDREALEELAANTEIPTPAALTAALVEYIENALGPARQVTIARYVLFMESVTGAKTEPLQQAIAEARAGLIGWAETILVGLDAPDPHQGARAVCELLDGLILHELTAPAAEFKPEARLQALLSSILPSAAS
jgi:DNA-binding transcriptional regulator YbjK